MAAAADTPLNTLLQCKAEGNELYKTKDYEGAIKSYAAAVKGLPMYEEESDDEDDTPTPEPEVLKQGAVVLCNRAACYMAVNKPIAALADAQVHAAAYLVPCIDRIDSTRTVNI